MFFSRQHLSTGSTKHANEGGGSTVMGIEAR